MNWLAKLLKSLRQGASALSPNCKEASRLQSRALDEPLSRGQRIGLRIHLVLCKWCRRYGHQIRFLRTLAGEHAEHEHFLPSQSLCADAKERMKRRLQAEKK